MKIFPTLLLAAAAAATATAAQAQEPSLTFNLGVVSLYKYNGVDQDSRQATDPKSVRPALQGGVDYQFGNGFYVGNWNSTGQLGNADLEIDLYGGYNGQLANGLGYGLGYIHYFYPGDKQFGNGGELYATLSYGIATVKLTHGVTDAYQDAQGNAKSRLSLTLAQPVNEQLTFKLVLADRNRAAGGFADFAVGADYTLASGLTLSALVSGAGKVDGVRPEAHKTRLIVGLTQTF